MNGSVSHMLAPRSLAACIRHFQATESLNTADKTEIPLTQQKFYIKLIHAHVMPTSFQPPLGGGGGEGGGTSPHILHPG